MFCCFFSLTEETCRVIQFPPLLFVFKGRRLHPKLRMYVLPSNRYPMSFQLRFLWSPLAYPPVLLNHLQDYFGFPFPAHLYYHVPLWFPFSIEPFPCPLVQVYLLFSLTTRLSLTSTAFPIFPFSVSLPESSIFCQFLGSWIGFVSLSLQSSNIHRSFSFPALYPSTMDLKCGFSFAW